MFLRRIGPDPHADGGTTSSANGCPDIWELTNGDFAVIGVDCTEAFKKQLPPTASCGPDEKIVVIERRILIGAKPDIPEF